MREGDGGVGGRAAEGRRVPLPETKDLSEVRSEGRQTGDKTVSL